ncbi:MAG: hypothetical protein ACOCXT_02715 [Candidatus Dojkabacteria bacterium]
MKKIVRDTDAKSVITTILSNKKSSKEKEQAYDHGELVEREQSLHET